MLINEVENGGRGGEESWGKSGEGKERKREYIPEAWHPTKPRNRRLVSDMMATRNSSNEKTRKFVVLEREFHGGFRVPTNWTCLGPEGGVTSLCPAPAAGAPLTLRLFSVNNPGGKTESYQYLH